MNKHNLYKYSIMVVDIIAMYLLYFISSFVSNNFNFSEINTTFCLMCLLFVGIKCLVQFAVGNYNILWKYKIKNSYIKMIIFSIVGNLFVDIVYLICYLNKFTTISFATILIVFLLDFAYICVSRCFVNYILENVVKKKIVAVNHKRTLIVGAGSCGSMILSEFGLNKEYEYQVVGFVDDSKDKIKAKLNGVKIYGPINEINSIIEKLMIEVVILALPTAGKERIKEITNLLDYKRVEVRIVPDTSTLISGNITKTIRTVSIEDLLGREAIKLDTSGLNSFIGGKIILVTGGGGSIGSEICRQVLKYNPKLLIIFDIYENTTYGLEMELDIYYRHNKIPKPEYLCLIGSVRDNTRLEEIFSKYKPDIIFHAAAHKHVPLMEDSPKEAIKNNVVGTYNVARLADKYHAEKMVLISTDKAVNPTNVMGATKRFCEMVVETWNNQSKHTKYSMVRFGNVLGSNGSVIPIFKRQISTGGPLTVTHKDINRYFMTIPEACGLVIQSGAYAKGGEKFILDMGKPVKIVDLAKKMIQLSGLELGKDIDIEYTGLRPGEKLYEELLLDYSKAKKTENNKIFVEECTNPLTMKDLEDIIEKLKTFEFAHNKEILMLLDKVEELKVERKKSIVVAK